MATWTLNYCNSYENDWSIQFQGDQGTMMLEQGGLQNLEGAVAEESANPCRRWRRQSRSSRTSRISWTA